MRAISRSLTKHLAVVGLAAILVGACNEPNPAPSSPEGSVEVTFPSTDGVSLSGRLFGPEEASVGVVLSHMLPADQRSWFDFARTLAGQGYLALTFDFRGYCPGGDGGCSEGERQVAAIWQDVEGAIAFLRTRGVRQVVLIGASMGGTASLVAAAHEGQGVTAVVTLSAPIEIEGLAATRDVLADATAAKLFIAGNDDTVAAEAAEQLYEGSILPKRYELVTTSDHGTDLLTGNQAGAVERLALDWLARYAPA